MRVKLLVDEGILGSTRKLWIDLPELNFVLDAIDYIMQTLQIKKPIELWMDDFYLHTNLRFAHFARDSELIQIKTKIVISPSPIEPPLQKRALKDQDSKKKTKNLRKELKRNPDSAPFQGKKIRFDSSGKISAVYSVNSNLNILSPSEEFDQKKSEWKIKPIPKRKPMSGTSTAPALISTAVKVLPHELEVNDVISFSTNSDSLVRVNFI